VAFHCGGFTASKGKTGREGAFTALGECGRVCVTNNKFCVQKERAIVKIEDIKIEDTADANYFIKKFFNNDYSKIQMTQLEQLVLAVYNMGKKNGVSADSAPGENEPKSGTAPAKTNPFKANDRVKTIEDIEIGHSGEYIKPDKIGIVTLIKGDTVTVLYEVGEDGEMLEINFSFDKLEKA
jgi:hypothetical protein